MKQFISIFIMLISSYVIYSQPFLEDFDSAPPPALPPGWTSISLFGLNGHPCTGFGFDDTWVVIDETDFGTCLMDPVTTSASTGTNFAFIGDVGSTPPGDIVEDVLFTPLLPGLLMSETYDIKFSLRRTDKTPDPTTATVFMKIQFLPDDGDGIPEPGGDDGPLKDITAISLTDGVDEAWAGFTVPWTPPADDDFFVGWQALWSEAGETGICLDDIEISGAPPLPVELSSLSANYNNGSIKLNWVTQTEINNYGFEIERKSGIKSHNSQWEKIAFIQGYGNSNSPKNYAYEDKDFASGYNSYRLKQIDSDGSFEYSKSIVINADAIPGNYALEQNYPNPFNPSTTISFTLPKAGFTTLKIYDMLGMEVASLVDEEKPAGRFEIEFEGKFLSAGVYFYELKTINFSQTKKLILMK